MRTCIQKSVFICLSIFSFLIIVVSCKPSIPSKYLQPDEMEDVLYDYHLAMSIANQNAEDTIRIKAYQQAVFSKYGITEEQFAASLQYYIRHTEKLQDIYEDLSKRYENEARLQGASENDFNQFGNIRSRGDTTDIWRGNRTLLLSPYAFVNKYSFSFKADSSFYKGDRFVFRYDSQFMVQDGMRDAVALLSVTFSNDSIATQMEHIFSDGSQTITIENNDTLGIKAVKGYFLMLHGQQPSTTFKLLIIRNIELVRMHIRKTDAMKQHKDSLTQQNAIRTIGGAPVSSSHAAIEDKDSKSQSTRTPQQSMRERGIPITR